jgi:hypothetical protein
MVTSNLAGVEPDQERKNGPRVDGLLHCRLQPGRLLIVENPGGAPCRVLTGLCYFAKKGQRFFGHFVVRIAELAVDRNVRFMIGCHDFG